MEIIKKTKIKSIRVIPNEDVYDITVENNHNFFANGILVHNCGEIFMGPYDSCRLMHINLSSFVDKHTKQFDYGKLFLAANMNMRLCDDLVELELEHVQQIIDHIKSKYIDDNRDELELWQKIYETGKSSRRAGCGATGLADALAWMGIKLGTQESYDVIEKIFSTKMQGEFKAQVELAKERGTFTGYDFKKEFETEYKGILKNIEHLTSISGRNEFYTNLSLMPWFDEYLDDYYKYGRRNVSWSTMAPVGTGAIMCQGSSGVEPVFKVIYIRRKKCMNANDRVDYVDEAGEKFTEFVVLHKPFVEWVLRNYGEVIDEHTDKEKLQYYFEQSPWYGAQAEDLTPEQHVHLQALVQKYTTHSISKTCNLPTEATEQQISDIYLEGWKENCKGITVYRAGSRSGVMIDENSKCKCEGTLTHSAPKRPKTLPCDIKRFRNGGEKWIAFVGLYNKQPYEIFTGLAEKIDMPEHITTCNIVKNKVEREMLNEETGKNELMTVSRYDIVYIDKNGEKKTIEDVGNAFRTEFEGYSRFISGLLRTGMWPEYVVTTLKHIKFKNETISSWKSGVIRAIKSYIKDGVVEGEKCPECGGKIVRENGCKHCEDCGWSACG